MLEVEYEVSVGSARTNGTTFVDDGASEDDVYLAIMNRLYYVEYEKIEEEDDHIHVKYEVSVGGGCATGEVIVSKDADDDDIRLEIMNDLYEVTYTIKEEK